MILRRKIKTVKKFFILLFVGHLPAICQRIKKMMIFCLLPLDICFLVDIVVVGNRWMKLRISGFRNEKSFIP